MVCLRIIYNGHNARLMHDPVCHCNQLYPDYNSRPSKLVATSRVRTVMKNLEKSWNFKTAISRPGKVLEK